MSIVSLAPGGVVRLYDPPAGLSPPGASGPCTYEPCDDVDPTPDYGNVLIG
jgi:hypothetical protein